MRDHVYNGPAALRASATSISVNGLRPATFVVEAWLALCEALTAFAE